MIRKRLKNWLSCTRCRLHKTRRQVVLGRGVCPAEVLFIGEAPGKSENLIGEAFVGRAGRILDKGIADAIRLSQRTDDPPTYYITNIVACIPCDERGGDFRQPLRDEEMACWERLELTAKLVDPDHIVLLGNVAKVAAGSHFPDALHVRHPAYIGYRGGTGSTEYRTFVRELTDLFKHKPAPKLGPKDTFGDRIKLKRKARRK